MLLCILFKLFKNKLQNRLDRILTNIRKTLRVYVELGNKRGQLQFYLEIYFVICWRMIDTFFILIFLIRFIHFSFLLRNRLLILNFFSILYQLWLIISRINLQIPFLLIIKFIMKLDIYIFIKWTKILCAFEVGKIINGIHARVLFLFMLCFLSRVVLKYIDVAEIFFHCTIKINTLK